MTSKRIGTSSGDQLAFNFDGHAYKGQAGDTIASALLANDVRVVGRSFKYHRPRGIYGFGVEEPNALVDVTLAGVTTPNVRATTEPLIAGMQIRAGNAAPSAAADAKGVLDRLSRFIPAGFYYKTFLWPNWHAYEPRIRQMAGLGHLDPTHEPPADSPQFNLACDVLVIGAGPAGLAAAKAAGQKGGKVILVDDQREVGGSLRHRDATIDGIAGIDWAGEIVSELVATGHRVLVDATAYGIYNHGLVAVWQRRSGQPDALWRVRAGHVVLATGAIERPLVFPDNDRPGVMSAEAALVYLKRFDVLVGQRIVVATNNSRAYAVAEALASAGAAVTLADTRQNPTETATGVIIRRGARVTGVHGKMGVEAVEIDGERVPADCLLLSGGFTPTVHLFCQAGGKLRYNERIAALVPNAAIVGMTVVGSANGTFDLAEILAEGHAAGSGQGVGPTVDALRLPPYTIEPAWPKPGSHGRQWIDFQNDVTVKDIELAARENFRSVEHLKRYTTLGMATDQGKTSNLNGLATMAAITGQTIEATGTTTYRPPFVPVPLKIIAGRRRGELFNPVKRLVLEPMHRAAGATFREYGGWLRPAWYGSGGEPEIQREALIARTSVGILDGSPLGKIEVFGPEAGSLMDFNFYNTISTLKPGRLRYAFMLTEGGVVYDDGVVAKVADDHYIVSCSSGHVAGVVARLEDMRQDRFNRNKVFVHNSTPEWATLTASGPRARDLVAGLDLGVDLSDAALPHMAFAAARFDGGAARVARVSFTGDRSYEISVSSLAAPTLFARICALLPNLDGTLMGSEALLLLRAEKGYLIAGKDTDGNTMPQDLGLTTPRDKRQGEYVGKRSLFSENARRSERPQFVGLVADVALPTGAHAVERNDRKPRSIGFVTSSYLSPTLQRPIALGLVERGLARIGESIEIYHLGRSYRATIAAPCALDPEGSRLNA